MVISSKWWRHTRNTNKTKKGVFGGKILSQTEIEKLSKRIESHEETEFEQFEKEFDQKLNNL